jgi:glycosyltransferase involved in cell wall biosynthesis
LKYWLLTTEYPPYFGGGISTYCYHTARMLEEKGHSVTVFIPDEQVKDHTIIETGSIRQVKFNTNRTGTGSFLGYVPKLSYEFAVIVRDLIRKEGKPDFIESQDYLAIPYYLLQFKLLGYPEFQEIPVILTLHSPAFLYLLYNREGIYEFPNYWTGELEKSCIQSADLVITPSHYMIAEIEKRTSLQLNKEKIRVIRNPYPISVQPVNRETITRNKIVFFGKLSPQKGVFEMFSYFKDLWDTGFQHPLTVIGGTEKVYYPEMKTMGQVIEGKYKKYFEAGMVKLIGKIHPDQKDDYLSDAQVILIPSLNDNLPYAAIEAMSIGQVILASMQGGQHEIIEDGINGFLFDHTIPGSFEKKLNQVLALSNEELVKAGQAARKHIASLLSYESIYSQKMEALQNIPAAASTRAIFPFVTTIRPDYITTDVDPEHKKGLLSVIIPFYNLGEYVKECVASIVGSTHKDIEVIIVNDGSTDPQSIQVLKELELLPAVKVMHKKNEGLAKSRNYGARSAGGEFMAFLDADDKVHPDYYSKAIKVLQQYNNVSFVGCWVQWFGKKNGVWPTWNPEPPYFLAHNSVNSSSLVYKTVAFLKGGLNDPELVYGIEDYESVVNMLSNGCRGVVLPERLFYYRIRQNSMFRSLSRYKILYSYSYIAEKHAAFYNTFTAELYSLLNANGPSFAYDNPSLKVTVSSKISYPNSVINAVKNLIKKNLALKKALLKINNKLKIRQI